MRFHLKGSAKIASLYVLVVLLLTACDGFQAMGPGAGRNLAASENFVPPTLTPTPVGGQVTPTPSAIPTGGPQPTATPVIPTPTVALPTPGQVFPPSSDLCSAAPLRVVNADPNTFQSALGSLQPGDKLVLAGGSYPPLSLYNLNGTRENCITVSGPASGAPAVVLGRDCCNDVEIYNSSFLAIKNLRIDSQGIGGLFGISAKGGNANLVHDILIEGNILVGLHGGQQTNGISTKAPTWNWVIRYNQILDAGTGMYLGNSDGSCPFVAGIIEHNLITNSIGYNMQVKHQATRPAIAGMPTGASTTLIRHNVFIKTDEPSPDGDRPNLLVGGFPSSGPGSSDLYQIYGNLIYHNPREALFQGSGRISFHDNILVGSSYIAAVFQNHDLPLKLAYVYNNTIYATSGSGIYFGSAASQGDAVVGNLVFSTTPISGTISNQSNNIVDSVANAVNYVTSPSTTLGQMNFYPLAGKAQGPALDLTPFNLDQDYNFDFNGTNKGTLLFRGAYSGSGANPGWQLQSGIKP